jgi:hypothetical protein
MGELKLKLQVYLHLKGFLGQSAGELEEQLHLQVEGFLGQAVQEVLSSAGSHVCQAAALTSLDQ